METNASGLKNTLLGTTSDKKYLCLQACNSFIGLGVELITNLFIFGESFASMREKPTQASQRDRPDGITRDVDLLFRHFRPQDDVGDDFDGGVETAAVDGGRVQERVAGGLAIANAAKLFKPAERKSYFNDFFEDLFLFPGHICHK